MRQEFFDPGDGMLGDAAEHIMEPGKRIDLDEFARGDEAAQHSRGLAAVIASEESPVVAANGHHAFILPISGMKLKFTIVGTRCTAGDCGCSAVNSALTAGSSMSRWRPAQ